MAMGRSIFCVTYGRCGPICLDQLGAVGVATDIHGWFGVVDGGRPDCADCGNVCPAPGEEKQSLSS